MAEEEKGKIPCVSECGRCCPLLTLAGAWASETIATFADILMC